MDDCSLDHTMRFEIYLTTPAKYSRCRCLRDPVDHHRWSKSGSGVEESMGACSVLPARLRFRLARIFTRRRAPRSRYRERCFSCNIARSYSVLSVERAKAGRLSLERVDLLAQREKQFSLLPPWFHARAKPLSHLHRARAFRRGRAHR